MKTAIAIILVFLYGIALVRPAVPLFEYYIKMEVYLEKCENKKRPELHCNGQCILMQKIKALQGDSQEVPRPAPVKINFEDYPIGFVEGLHAISSFAINLKKTFDTLPKSILSSPYRDAVFHPPAISV